MAAAQGLLWGSYGAPMGQPAKGAPTGLSQGSHEALWGSRGVFIGLPSCGMGLPLSFHAAT